MDLQIQFGFNKLASSNQSRSSLDKLFEGGSWWIILLKKTVNIEKHRENTKKKKESAVSVYVLYFLQKYFKI